MAENDEIIGVGWKFDMAGLERQLAEVPNLTREQATTMVGELNRSIKAAEKAARDAAKATGDAVEKAKARLKSLAEASTPARKMAADFERAKAEIARLAQITGDQESATTALAAAEAKYKAQVDASAAAEQEATDRARARLSALEEASDPAKKLAADYARARAELEELARVTGDEVTANKLLAQAEAKYKAQVEETSQAEAKAAASARERLDALADAGDPAKQLTKNFEKLKKEIEDLAHATGDQEAADRALAAAEAEHKKKLQDLADAEEEAKSANNRLADSADEVGDTAGKLGAGLGLINEDLGAMGGLVGDAADGLVGMAAAAKAAGINLAAAAAAAGVIAVAIGAATAVYKLSQREVDRFNAIREREAEIAESLQGTERELAAAQREALVATGKMSEASARELGIREAARQAIIDYAASQKEQRRELYESIIASQKYADAQKKVALMLATVRHYTQGTSKEFIAIEAKGIEDFFDSITNFQGGIDDAKAALAALDNAVATEASNQKKLIEVQIQASVATDQAALADEEAAKAKEKLAARIAEAKAALEEEGQRLESLRDLQAQLEEAARSARESQLEGQAALDAAHKREMEQLQSLYQDTLAQAEGTERLQATEAYLAAKVALEEKYKAESEKLQEEETDKTIEEAKKRSEAFRDSVTSAFGAVAQLSSTFSGILGDSTAKLQQALEEQGAAMTRSERDQIEKQIAARKKAAMLLFRASQGSALVEAGINLQLAISEASASAPFPYNIPAIVAATATGTATVASIAAQQPPTFHTGYAPDEYGAKLRMDEGVLTGRGVRAAGGPQAVRELNRGNQAPARSDTTQVAYVLDGRILETTLVRNKRAGGQLAQVGSRRVGHSNLKIQRRGGG